MMLIAWLRGEPRSLGGLPLTVITAAGRDRMWMGMRAELAALSTRGAHVVADRGGRYLRQGNPAVVAAAVRNLLTGIRRGRI